MRAIPIILLAGFVAPLWAQLPAAEPSKTFVSAADVRDLIENAKKTRKGNQAQISQMLLRLAPYQANLEYRTATGQASVHEKEAELFCVVDGAGTLVIGGKLLNERRTNADNLSGSGLEGGTPQALAKGDFAFVPENTPHWFSEIKGTLVLMSLHLPRGSGAK